MIGLAYVLLWGALLAYIIHARSGKSLTGRAATATTTITWSVFTAGLIHRGLTAGHWPLTNRYEIALCITWAMLMIYLLLEISWHEKRAGSFILLISLMMMTYAVTRPSTEQELTHLLPVLRTVWLQLHAMSTVIGYGAFGVAAGLGLTRLFMHRFTKDEQRIWLPSQEETERTMERAIALGFPWLTLGILTGAIWAQKAWGRYWGWDPKETWALITWFWYLLILHIRALRTWRGLRLASLVVVGFGIVLFTFIGVPWLVRTIRLESLHGF